MKYRESKQRNTKWTDDQIECGFKEIQRNTRRSNRARFQANDFFLCGSSANRIYSALEQFGFICPRKYFVAWSQICTGENQQFNYTGTGLWVNIANKKIWLTEWFHQYIRKSIHGKLYWSDTSFYASQSGTKDMMMRVLWRVS